MTDPERPLVSIIVPVYNVERYLDCCLDSIRGQTYDRLEIIVVEDCSTDASLSRAQPHLVDPRVRLIRHERNSGLSAARNTGIEAATGGYVMFVDSDDAIAPSLVEACVAQALETRADVVVFDFAAFRDGEPMPVVGEATSVGNVRKLQGIEYFRFPQFAWLKFIRRELLENPFLRFPVGYYYEDWPFHWELGFITTEIQHGGFIGYRYRLRGDSITASGGSKLLHVMTSQQLVAEVIVRNAGATAVKSEFARKVQAAAWFILTNIDLPLLREASQRVAEHLAKMRIAGFCGPFRPKHRLVRILLLLPEPLRTGVLHCFRFLLDHASPARRERLRLHRLSSSAKI